MAVVGNDKAVLFGNFLLQAFDLRAEKFDERVTLRTDQVVVVIVLVFVFIARAPIVEVDFPGQFGFDEQAQGSINRREANGFVTLFDEVIEFLDAQVRLGFQKRPQDEVTLGRPLEPMLDQVTVKQLELLVKSIGGWLALGQWCCLLLLKMFRHAYASSDTVHPDRRADGTATWTH